MNVKTNKAEARVWMYKGEEARLFEIGEEIPREYQDKPAPKPKPRAE